MTHKISTLLLFLLMYFIFSCQNKDTVTPSETDIWQTNSPQVYDLQIPDKFSKNITIPADNPLTVQGVELGRMLFYEKKLSGDNTLS